MGILTCLELYQLSAKTEWQEMDNPNLAISIGTAAGTRSIFNLTQPVFGTCHVFVGNSAFVSVTTTIQLAKENLGFIGVVKKAIKRFPMEPLQKTILPK